MNSSIKDDLKIAIRNNRKIKFRMNGTPQEKYLLYHPYAMVVDKLSDEISIVGLIEKDYEENGERDNQLGRPTLNSILEVSIEEENFEPVTGWKDNLRGQTIAFIVTCMDQI